MEIEQKVRRIYKKYFYPYENIDIEKIIWDLKSKKLTYYEKQILNEYKTISKLPKVSSNSLKRGHISTRARKIVNLRDHSECCFCGSNYKPELAHIKSRGAGGKGNPRNLITLCREHHRILDNPIGIMEISKRNQIKSFIEEWRKGSDSWLNWYEEQHGAYEKNNN